MSRGRLPEIQRVRQNLKPRRIGRIPGSVQMLPLTVDGRQHLEVMRHVLRKDDLERVVGGAGPRTVDHSVQEALVGIDLPESAEGLIGAGGVEAVDLGLRVVLLDSLVHTGNVDAERPGELMPEPDVERVRVGLTEIGVEL